MESLKFEKETMSDKVSKFVDSRKVIFIAIAVILVVCITVCGLGSELVSSSNLKAFEAVDKTLFTMVEDSADLKDEELEARATKALTSLAPYASKKGVVGVRANKLSGDISFLRKNYEDAASFYSKAALLDKKAYTSSVCAFCAASSYENLGKLDEAIKFYEMASKDSDFLMSEHALYNVGRVYEAKGDAQNAIKTYKSLKAKGSSTSWANLAVSRLLLIDNQ